MTIPRLIIKAAQKGSKAYKKPKLTPKKVPKKDTRQLELFEGATPIPPGQKKLEKKSTEALLQDFLDIIGGKKKCINERLYKQTIDRIFKER